MRDRLLALIDRFAGLRLVVAGDVILDEYITGRAARLSREAPIPVLEFETRHVVVGGAGNPAVNLARLGAHTALIGVIGTDPEAALLHAAVEAAGISTAGLVADPARPTTLKTRIMAHMGLRFPQQVARIDRLSRAAIDSAIEAALAEAVRAALAPGAALVFSDYRGGMLTPALVATALADAGDRLTAADAQGDFAKYRGAGVVKCNADEARDHLRRPLHTDDDFAGAARALFEELALSRAMVITRGGDGATAATPSGTIHCPAPAVTDVYDTVGAGDTAIALIAIALLANATPEEAITLANLASGLVVRRVGNYAPAPDELRAAVAAAFP